MNELCHRAHRFAIVRRSQIVPAALFKMLKTRPASDKRRIRVGRRIYASGSRHKSCRVALHRRRDIRLRIEIALPVSSSTLDAITNLRIIHIASPSFILIIEERDENFYKITNDTRVYEHLFSAR